MEFCQSKRQIAQNNFEDKLRDDFRDGSCMTVGWLRHTLNLRFDN